MGKAAIKGSESGYPMGRIVALMMLRSHLLVGWNFGSYGANEIRYAWPLLDKISSKSLTIWDGGFFGARFLVGIEGVRHRHWLTRARSDLNFRVVQKFARGDDLIEVKVSARARRQDPSSPATWQMRAIRYRRKGFAPQLLLTSLRDPNEYPVTEIAEL